MAEIAGATHDRLKIVYDHCLQDDYCRSMLGPNVKHTINEAVKTMFGPNPKECVKQILYFCKVEFDFEKPANKLSFILSNLLYQTAYICNSIKTPQFEIVFLKATADCVASESFIEKVLIPLKTYIKIKDAGNESSSSSLTSQNVNKFDRLSNEEEHYFH